MNIFLSPQVSDKKLVVNKQKDVLTINGESFDFTQFPEGAKLPASAVSSAFLIGEITRDNGHLNLTILLPIAVDAPNEVCFPTPLMNVPNGVVKLPGGANAN